MPERSHQTVTIRRGKHASPDRGACVVELASMLAGERFSDHPPTVCPVIAGFLRGYNDLMPEQDLPELYPIAGHTVGGWSLKRSPASIEASSTTHAPRSGEACLPRRIVTVWWLRSGTSSPPRLSGLRRRQSRGHDRAAPHPSSAVGRPRVIIPMG